MFARIHFIIITTQIYAKITMQKLNADMGDFEKQLHDLNSQLLHILSFVTLFFQKCYIF